MEPGKQTELEDKEMEFEQKQAERDAEETEFENHELDPAYNERGPKKKGNNKGFLALGLSLLAFLSKGKFILVLVLSKLKFLFVFLKLGKFATTAISMAMTIWVYAAFYGLWFALGLVGLLFVHEFGHYFMAKRVGLAVSGPVFIPFVGALIGMKEEPKDVVMEAKVGFAGPLFGSAASVVSLMIYSATGSTFAAVMANLGFILNLFNLMPVHPLDGGRVVGAISPYLWLIGIPILGYLTIISFSPILLLVLILGIVQAYKLWRDRKLEGPYYQVPFGERIGFTVIYFGLVVILGLGTSFTLDILS